MTYRQLVRVLLPFRLRRGNGRARRTARRRARRAVLSGLAAFVAATLGFSFLLETTAHKIRDPEHGYRLAGVRELQRTHADRPLIAFMGSSRTQNAIAPEAMAFPDQPGAPLVYNYGLTGAQPFHFPMIARRLTDSGVSPSALVVELFPAILGADDPAKTRFAHSSAGLTLTDLRRLSSVTDRTILPVVWVESRLNPWYSFRLVLMSHANEDWLPWESRVSGVWRFLDSRGFYPYPGNPDAIASRRAARLEVTHRTHVGLVANLRVSELTLRSYRQLVADCRARGIPVAFYLSPESPTFRSWYTPQSRETLRAFCRCLSEELGCRVFEAPDLVEDDFADGHHMLPTGAAKYSRWLAEAHLKPWLAKVLPPRPE